MLHTSFIAPYSDDVNMGTGVLSFLLL